MLNLLYPQFPCCWILDAYVLLHFCRQYLHIDIRIVVVPCYIIENDYRNYRIFTFTIFKTIFILDIFEYKSFEITVILIAIPEDLIERTLCLQQSGNKYCRRL